MKPKIVFLDAMAVGDADLSIFETIGEFVHYAETAPDQVIERSLDADVIITNKVKLFAKEIDQLPRLKLICISATGMNNVEVEYAQSKGIPVKNVAGYSTDSVAQATFALALSLIHQSSYYDSYVKNGVYSRQTLFTHHARPFFEIKGKRWGIIGLGAIGQKVATIASAFGADVAYYSTSGKNTQQPYPQYTLEQLLRECDIVSIHAPLNAQTENLITSRELQWMKKQALLINVGRGGIVNETDLHDALLNNRLGGAGLDVFSVEPISESHPLLDRRIADKMVLTPHNAWASKEARSTLIKLIYAHIVNHFEEK